ncbi:MULTISPECIES: cysteine dioxygenase [unclassified Streptomyces]|uniref:cysteine dioxygenase n=1 Tax=Streptomyces TaxID=1883 RepID=UPI00081F6C37|nr:MULTISPECIES: cysteine dioxygenase [unclassified Streptomyces]MYW98072.1 cysteine dioxygenase [Streptomyces sp. SID8378]OSC74717.1 cysteine dioxygenase [Streptomyces sp. BF-3]PVC79162.1 cysteine dioxygenase [Streptomyces sp. CS131]PVC95004.1 cysteine dioxygenase [Streptomyces sp. CS147]UCA52541.1 cysteine dioxygenase [Streptomyces sp. WA6-1-16]
MSSAHSAVPTAGSVPSPSSTSSTVSSSASAASAASSGGAAPTIAELLEFVRRTARNEALIASLPLDPEGRTWIRLDGPGGSEAWLIGWPPGTGTGWHDHADSIGAFTTAAGALKEHSLAVRLPTDGWKTLELTDGVDRSRELATGQGRAFGQNHVHEVLNESEDVHAVSVHAYYPPLPRIRRFSRTGAVLRLEQTESPGDWQ